MERKSSLLLQAGVYREGRIITSILNSPEVRFLMAASRPMGITLTPPTRSFPLICKVRRLLLCWLVEGGVGDQQGPVWAGSQSEERHHCVITHHSGNHHSSNHGHCHQHKIIFLPPSCDTKYTKELEIYPLL